MINKEWYHIRHLSHLERDLRLHLWYGCQSLYLNSLHKFHLQLQHDKLQRPKYNEI